MCNNQKLNAIEPRVCSRCLRVVRSDSWEDSQVFLNGEIRLSYPGNIDDYFTSRKYGDGHQRSKLFQSDPLLNGTFEYQGLTIKWGRDRASEKAPNNYYMCSACHRRLMEMLGEFFGWSDDGIERRYTVRNYLDDPTLREMIINVLETRAEKKI